MVEMAPNIGLKDHIMLQGYTHLSTGDITKRPVLKANLLKKRPNAFPFLIDSTPNRIIIPVLSRGHAKQNLQCY